MPNIRPKSLSSTQRRENLNLNSNLEHKSMPGGKTPEELLGSFLAGFPSFKSFHADPRHT